MPRLRAFKKHNIETSKECRVLTARSGETLDPWREGLIDKPTQEAIVVALGDLIRQARLASGLKLSELADRCNVSASVMSRIERARRWPGLSVLMVICAALGIRLSDLFKAAEDAAVPLPASPREGRFHELLATSPDVTSRK
jgi:ribosome-binding protein aMBF1 (putative translation factor)